MKIFLGLMMIIFFVLWQNELNEHTRLVVQKNELESYNIIYKPSSQRQAQEWMDRKENHVAYLLRSIVFNKTFNVYGSYNLIDGGISY